MDRIVFLDTEKRIVVMGTEDVVVCSGGKTHKYYTVDNRGVKYAWIRGLELSMPPKGETPDESEATLLDVR